MFSGGMVTIDTKQLPSSDGFNSRVSTLSRNGTWIDGLSRLLSAVLSAEEAVVEGEVVMDERRRFDAPAMPTDAVVDGLDERGGSATLGDALLVPLRVGLVAVAEASKDKEEEEEVEDAGASFFSTSALTTRVSVATALSALRS